MHTFLLLLLLNFQDTTINSIKEKYTFINQHISTYQKISKDVFDKSLEGGELNAYLSHDSIVLIVETLYGEMGKSRTEYYYDKGNVIFVYSRLYHYDLPITEPKFDVKNATVDEDRFYFSHQHLVRWISGKEIREKRDAAFIEKEGANIKYAKELKIEAFTKEEN